MSIDKAVQNYCIVMSAELLPFPDKEDDLSIVLQKELGIDKAELAKSVEDEYHNVLQNIAKMRVANAELDRLLSQWKKH